jgi:UDP-N-acetylmuramyl tripeptide synthase
LTGSNLFFAGPGAVLETQGVTVDGTLICAWRARVERARRVLEWSTSLPVKARRHAGGVSLAIGAPLDQLLTSTEVNEWAWCAALVAREPALLADVEAALLEAARELTEDPGTVVPPVLEERAAFARFDQLAHDERRPHLLEVVAAAVHRGLQHVLDDHELTLGTGAGHRSWPLTGLPVPDEVPWNELHDVPIAVVTGSNGKTTTVRLLAACARAHGWRDGYCCTDGVFAGARLVEAGDYSGPAGTRRVLRNPAVDAAILEMARGGILRRGLAIETADVAVITNVSSDHFGEYGIDDLAGLAEAKFVVAHLVAGQGLLVLNADDAQVREAAAHLPERLDRAPTIGWFALDYDTPLLHEHRARGGSVCGVRDGRLILAHSTAEQDLGAIDAMPLTVRGNATYNVSNLAGAALAAVGLGIPSTTLREVFAMFGHDPLDNVGRLMRYKVDGVEVIVDYAHNPEGLRGVLTVAQALRAPQGRLLMLLGHAGNRRDEDIAELARVAAACRPDRIIVKETESHLRGRALGEVPALLRSTLLAAGMRERDVTLAPSELEAVHQALAAAQPGDAVALLVHSSEARTAVLDLLRERSAR